MNILDLAEEAGLSPKHSAFTNGGEYKSGCPKCQEGKDRFCIWPKQGNTGRYWCRVCEAQGDAIQFCRDFLGMNFHEACQKVNITPPLNELPSKRKKGTFVPSEASPPSSSWQQTGKNFIAFSHQKLITDPIVIKQLSMRGITIETIEKFHLGWNPQTFFDSRERWGLAQEILPNGKPKCQWLPKGIVIPTLCKGYLLKVKIRRTDWHQEDTLPKYVEVSGSRCAPSVFGDPSKPMIVVESELDAILIQQEASQLVCSVALGGVSKKPDAELDALLKKAPLILLSLDFDEAGKKRFPFWVQQYPNIRPWPIPFGKSPGDAIEKFPINVVKWIKSGFSALDR